MRRNVIGFVAMSYFLLVSACGNEGPTPQNAGSPGAPGEVSQVSFSTIRSSILQPKCVRCHAGINAAGGIDLSSYTSVMGAASAHGHAIVEAGNADGSHLYESVSTGSMPQGAAKLSSSEIGSIRSWIEAGAKND
jgi:uncharacterized membrane protein